MVFGLPAILSFPLLLSWGGLVSAGLGAANADAEKSINITMKISKIISLKDKVNFTLGLEAIVVKVQADIN
ncbi:hypothetical protein [Arsukibacterium perlucidum]|uniref:hypothetical protein n=1 Tax=Arsukibacterium perlucidum TaxID=368811 RepID=UPI0003A2B0D3|nr:hypothetical protein [Arsukibacterium perlucidum]